MQDINISLHVSDALDRPADFAIIGSAPALVERVERESGVQFEPFRYAFPFGVTPQQLWRTRLLSNDNFVWRHVACLSGRSGRRVRHAFHQEWIELLLAGLMRFEPEVVVLVPYSDRHPETVAATMLFHLWLYGNMDWANMLGIAKHVPRRFEIADRTSVDVFRDLLSDHDRLRALIRHEASRVYGAPPVDEHASLGLRVETT